jgi:hypothetical protein
MDVRAEETQTRRGYFAASPYVALSAERLAEHGFVTRADDGSLEYWAPDANVLLSDSFLDNHCFHIAPPEASDSRLVGLAFEPVAGRAVTEIRGVLWIDAETSELERLDFRYVNLPFGERTQWDAVGGRVEFERLNSGMWIVRRWRIRMPVVEMRSGADATSGRGLVLSEIQEVSGEVVDVNVAAVRRLPIAAAVRVGITGIVSAEGRPVAGVAVVLTDSTGARVASAVTNGAGTFRFPRPGADGDYRLTAEHIGYRSTVHDVTLGDGESIVVEMSLATRAVPLGEIRVTARRQDFLSDAGYYHRRDQGRGWFVDPEEIERRKPSRVTDLLRGASGVEVISQGAFDADIRLFASQRLQGDCPPTIYIDGVAARLSPRSGPPLTRLVDVASVAALEVLRRPSEIPARYRGAQSACGVILIWLKR